MQYYKSVIIKLAVRRDTDKGVKMINNQRSMFNEQFFNIITISTSSCWQMLSRAIPFGQTPTGAT